MIVNDRVIESGEVQSALIDADRASIKQALRIFVDNATKYTPAGGTVTVSCVKNGVNVDIAVSDTGCGISGSELSAIFERFYRSDTARSAQTPGHGLGLSIAKIIVLSHKGKIRVKSKVGAGSTFTMEIPRV
jgi:signal transduction histidine kinase